MINSVKAWHNKEMQSEVYKMKIDKQLENELFDNGIYEAWQFVMNTARTLAIVEYCKETILRLLSSMQQEYEEWNEALWNDLITQDSKVKKVTVTTNSLPEYLTYVAGKDISTHFLLDKLTKDFF